MNSPNLGKMPRLDAVSPEDRAKIFSAVEKIDRAKLEAFKAWAAIERAVPNAKVEHVYADAYGVYQDVDTRNFLILADVSLSDESGYSDSVSTTITAKQSENGKIEFESISVNLPDPGPAFRP